MAAGAHAASADERDDFVGAEPHAGHDGHGNRESTAGLYGGRPRRHTKKAVLSIFQPPVLTRDRVRLGRVRAAAKRAKVSLNAFLIDALAQAVASPRRAPETKRA